MKLSQLCLGSAAIIAAYANQVMAAAPAFDEWVVTSGTISGGECPTSGYSCGSAITDTGFYQRMVPEETSEQIFFQTIITEGGGPSSEPAPAPSEQTTPAPTCPEGYTCGDVIVGPTFRQREITDGSNILFITIKNDAPLIQETLSAFGGSTPFQLFHTEPGMTLKPGQHLIAATGDTLAEQTANLQLNRTKLTPDPEYIELNQQSEANQKIFRKVVDAEIAGVTLGATATLIAQLNVPLNVPNGYELRMRVLTTKGWGDFVSDENNHLLNAVKNDDGYCPMPNSITNLYVSSEYVECLGVRVQDGGPNDSDGKADGNITLTIGPVTTQKFSAVPGIIVAEPTTTVAVTQTTGTNAPTQGGGGGAWSWWMSLSLLFRLGRSQRN